MAPPIRTGLDQRLDEVRAHLEAFFKVVTKSIEEAKVAVGTGGEASGKRTRKMRRKAQRRAEEISQDLLLILALNQPLVQDLRVVATLLRGVDTLERVARHARDVVRDLARWKVIANDAAALPEPFRAHIDAMIAEVEIMFEALRACTLKGDAIDEDTIADAWRRIGSFHHKARKACITASFDELGGEEGRILLSGVARRIERSGYNLVRWVDLWHHATENEWIHIEDENE